MATWPSLRDLKAMLRLGDSPDEDPVLDDARLAAIDYVTGRVDPKWILIDPLGPQIPDGLKYATTLVASRFYRRRDSLDGTIGWGDMGVVRVGIKDPDVEAALARYLAMVAG
jgi:gp6-like head-tail connector protein